MLRGQRLRPELRRIIQIGRVGFCSPEELWSFLPPDDFTKSFIFSLEWEHVRAFVRVDAIPLIKGLHLIEEAYKKETANGFGFGSPSPAYRMLEHMRHEDQQIKDADELTEWIRNNGGNYYIK